MTTKNTQPRRKLQVFVSSTFTDLVDERQAAVAAILKAGHIPAGMELFTAGDRSQMHTIEKWIDESDVYMLILAGRYGTVEQTSGLSYTELEYDYAIAKGKPTFAVVINEEALENKVKTNGTNFIERQNTALLANFRKRVLGNMSSFFSDCKDIKLCVHESLADFSANPNLKGWVSASELDYAYALQEEVAQLRERNAALVAEVNKLMQMPRPSPKADTSANDELVDVLKAIEIRVPGKVAGGEEYKSDLLTIADRTRDILINGTTNRADASVAESFVYHTIFPKLQAYGLAENEKVAGVQYRRSFLNKVGRTFFAELEKKRLLSQKSNDAETMIGETETEEKIQGRKLPIKPKRAKNKTRPKIETQ